MTMPTLGLSVIARDEEKTIGRLLESVKGCFDQIVVVDTGSADKTVEIAKSFGAEIHHFKWIDDFSAARNFALSKVTTEFWAWLDCDDVMAPEDRIRLLELKPRLGEADTYLMNYNYAQDEFGRPVTQFFRHRILRNDGKCKWREPIHEHIGVLPNLRECVTNITVTHKRTHEEAKKDAGRNIRILEKAYKADPENARLRYYFGKELWAENRFQEAIQVLEEHQKKGDWHENMVNGAFFLALAYRSIKDDEKAIEAALRGIGRDPRWAEFYSVIGQIHLDRGHWDKAKHWFEIAASSPIPKTYGTVLIDNYTWTPRDRLCKCEAELGNFRKSYEWNESALSYRPEDPRLRFNRVYLQDILFDRLSYRPRRLNLGSGGKPATGYRNCDLYPGTGVEFVFDQSQLPFETGTVHAIRSEHALEHSASHYQAEAAIKEWARALRPGGALHLMVPDLEACARAYFAEIDRARVAGERWTPKEWYKYTIYGIQKSQGDEPDEAQHHRTGFSKPELVRLLEGSGFAVEEIRNYDGWGTPSIEVHAVQTAKPVRVVWMVPSTGEEHPATRIRRLNVSRALAKEGVDSKIFLDRNGKTYRDVDEGAAIAQARSADVAVFTVFTSQEKRIMDGLRQCGVAAVADYCEDLQDLNPEVGECLQSASLIVCCSTYLAGRASQFGRTLVVKDAYEEIPKAFVKKLFAFDVDHTLEISEGPIKLADLKKLRAEGHLVGLCGNWPVFLERVKNHGDYVSFMGPRSEPFTNDKDEYLRWLKANFKADEYVMVGNILGQTGASDDKGAAERTGWRFVQEASFDKGER
jgi:glycosyltransferase involved in cell wall biosynthesis/predicted SAM-dependent methyltransferase